MKSQETIALGIVALVSAMMIVRFFRRYIADSASKILLQHGHVKAAMRIRNLAILESECSKCEN
jgi:hypothetical protein